MPAPPAGAGGRVGEFQPRADTEPGTTLVETEMGHPHGGLRDSSQGPADTSSTG